MLFSGNVAVSEQRACCFLGCINDAEFTLWWAGDSYSNYTEPCRRHIADLMTDADTHYLYPIQGIARP